MSQVRLKAMKPSANPGADASSDEQDNALLRRVALGDRSAFDTLYRQYWPRLTRFLDQLTHRPYLVEELVNDTLLVVWRKAGAFEGNARVSTWVFAIAYRKAMKARSRWPDPVEQPAVDQRASADPGPDEEMQHERLHRALVAAMGTLSADHRTVVDLTYFHELGYREIAVILECPVDTVKTRMFHARRHLKKKLNGVLADWI